MYFRKISILSASFTKYMVVLSLNKKEAERHNRLKNTPIPTSHIVGSKQVQNNCCTILKKKYSGTHKKFVKYTPFPKYYLSIKPRTKIIS